MARSQTENQKAMIRQWVQQQRDGLYAKGHQNLHMVLPQEVVEKIGLLKKRYDLPSQEAVVTRIIEKSKERVNLGSLVLRASDSNTVFRRISPIVPSELVDYVREIQQRFRKIAYGPVFEMIIAEVGDDLSGPAPELEVNPRGQAVSG